MADDIATKRSFRQEIWRMIWRKIGESYLSVSPIVLMITVLFFTGVVSDFYWPVFVVFLIAAVCIGLGLALFQLGCDQSISKVGGIIGSTLFKQRKLWLVCIMTFFLGVIITVAEPDLKLMANQIGFDNEALADRLCGYRRWPLLDVRRFTHSFPKGSQRPLLGLLRHHLYLGGHHQQKLPADFFR
jgi:hypothetical protein